MLLYSNALRCPYDYRWFLNFKYIWKPGEGHYTGCLSGPEPMYPRVGLSDAAEKFGGGRTPILGDSVTGPDGKHVYSQKRKSEQYIPRKLALYFSMFVVFKNIIGAFRLKRLEQVSLSPPELLL